MRFFLLIFFVLMASLSGFPLQAEQSVSIEEEEELLIDSDWQEEGKKEKEYIPKSQVSLLVDRVCIAIILHYYWFKNWCSNKIQYFYASKRQ